MSTSSALPSAAPATDRAARPHGRRWTRRIGFVSIAAVATAFGSVASVPSTVLAAPIASVPLGLVATFGVLTPAAVGNAAPEPVTVIRGDVGGGGAITGFPPGLITGTVYTGSAVNPMLTDLQAAYDNAANRPAGTALPADFNGANFLPGVHSTIAAAGTAAGGTFSIDGGGDPNSVFVFQVGGALALGANTTMTLTGGAQAKNVFWQVVGAGGLGAGTTFVGTLMAGTAVSAGAGSTVNGRLTSLTGAITMSSTQLYSSPPSVSIDGGPTANTTSSTPLISGTTSARAPMTVVVSIDGADQAPSTPSSSGIWSLQAPLLINGAHTIVARSVDGAGNVGSFTQVLTVDTTPPVVSIDGDTAVVTNDLTPTISGTSDIAPGQLVTLTATRTTPATTLTRSAIVQGDQTWSIAPSGFSPGQWTVVARVADPAGNQNSDTQTLTIDAVAPAAAITSSALTNDPTPTITGTTEAGATVAVSIDGLALTGVTQGASWSATATVALGNGNHNVSVTSTDTAGNATVLTQALNVDLVLPMVAIDPGPADSANDSTPTITGTTDAAIGATVSVTIDGGAPLNAFVQSDGWNVTPSTALAVGVHTVVATVSDPAGNVGSATQTLTIDTTNPTVVITGGTSRTTADATPTIAGSSSDVPLGSNVVVHVAGQNLPTTITTGGLFEVTAAAISPNATYFVFVTVTDAAGNTGSANQSLTINAIAPTVSYVNGATATTNDNTPMIGGSSNAAVGSAVVVTVGGQTLSATVQPGGSWNVTAAVLATGPFSVVTSVTDPDGNVGSAAQVLTIDTIDPVVVVGGGVTPPPSPSPAPSPGPTPNPNPPGNIPPGAEYTSVGPKRVFDTRPGASSNALRDVAKRQVGGGYELEVKMTDLAGFVPNDGVGSVSLNVTATGSAAAGYITVYACGIREDVSSVNFPAGRNVANAVLAPVSPTGTVCFFADTPTDIIVDLNGWFAAGEAFHSVGPKRVFDTRVGASPNALRSVPKTKLAAGGMLEVRLTDLAGYVPVDGVGAVSLNVVVTNPEGYGYITVYSCDTRKEVSSVNYVAGQTVANAVAVPVSPTGTVCFYSLAATDLIVDINGWIEAGSSFHAVSPVRVLDTRTGSSPTSLRAVPRTKIGGANVLQVQVSDLPGYTPAAGVGAVSLNVTATGTEGAGYITVYACGAREEVSSLNYDAGSTVANAVLAPVSAAGTICLYSLEPTDVIVDINGWISASSPG